MLLHKDLLQKNVVDLTQHLQNEYVNDMLMVHNENIFRMPMRLKSEL